MKKDNFKCRKTILYRNCGNCIDLNGICDYEKVFEHKNAFICPICFYKDIDEKCNNCIHKKENKENE